MSLETTDSINSNKSPVEYEELGPTYSERYLAKVDNYKSFRKANCSNTSSNRLTSGPGSCDAQTHHLDSDRLVHYAPSREFVEEDDKEAENTLIPVRFCQPESPTVVNTSEYPSEMSIQITQSSPSPPLVTEVTIVSQNDSAKAAFSFSNISTSCSNESETSTSTNNLITSTSSTISPSTSSSPLPVTKSNSHSVQSVCNLSSNNASSVPYSTTISSTAFKPSVVTLNSSPTPSSSNTNQTTPLIRPKTSGWAKLFATTLQRSKSAVNSEMIQKNMKIRPNRKSEQTNISLVTSTTASNSRQQQQQQQPSSPFSASSIQNQSTTYNINSEADADQISLKMDMRKKKRSLGVDMREKLNFFRKSAGDNLSVNQQGSSSGFTNKISLVSPNFMANLNDVWKSTGGPPTRDQVWSWSQSFENLLHDQHGLSIFFEFLRSEFSDENLEFWAECQAYRSINCPVTLQKKATQIFQDFVAEQSPREINIDSVTRVQTSSEIINATPTTFDQSQKKIQALMEKDSYQRFLRSEIYHSLLEQHDLIPASSTSSPSTVANSVAAALPPSLSKSSSLGVSEGRTFRQGPSVPSSSSTSQGSYLPGLLPRVARQPPSDNSLATTGGTVILVTNSSNGTQLRQQQSIDCPSLSLLYKSAPSSPKNDTK